MARALRLTGWVAGGLVLAALFFALWASLKVRAAVDEGALARPVWSCLAPAHAARREALADRAFVRGIQAHIAGERGRSSAWHAHGLVAYVGAHAGFSARERQAAVAQQIAGLPVCPTRSAKRA
ncbi:hypothetical protein [Erythrobacter colymbi]|uniref:hypothetical protein n=1 Tax=Erythrobacter colymbi TaxID=1161202 RepID=UPI000A387C84|nr:hypothetical protein [Erythrobacter colymbi]